MEQNREIRPLAGCEIEEALGLVWDVFSEYEAADCTEEGVDEFWTKIDYEYLIQRAGDGEVRFWGAFDEGRMVGVCMLHEPDHVELLYVDGEYQSRGVGTSLLKKAVLDMKEQDTLLRRITANVPDSADGFFRALGFTSSGASYASGGMTYTPMAVESKEEQHG
jgi:Acetyltransferase (GNAT) family.